MLCPDVVERALRVAARYHRDQRRKGSDLPYIAHPAAVALILARAGFPQPELLAAALLHDVIEDTDYTPDELRREFPDAVVALVLAVSEEKVDDAGGKRPWEVRKRDHIAAVADASAEARAVVLADKLHNLASMLYDLRDGRDIWRRFGASPERVLWYHREMVTAARGRDEQLDGLAADCRRLIDELAAAAGAC